MYRVVGKTLIINVIQVLESQKYNKYEAYIWKRKINVSKICISIMCWSSGRQARPRKDDVTRSNPGKVIY